MTYLFGDSSPSQLDFDYIEFLRDALDFAVQVLAADERMNKGSARAVEARLAGEAEAARLEALGAAQAQAIESFDVGAAESATAQCAHVLLRGAAESVSAAIEKVRAAAAADVARVEDEVKRDRQRSAEALAVFLKKHDLPQMTSEMRLQQLDGSRYAARLYLSALGDLRAVLELDIPPAHPLASVARVDKLVERLEVHAPESGGFLRKEVKLRPQRLDKEFITALVSNPRETLIQLRGAADGSGVGFDLAVREDGSRVTLRRVGEGSDLPPFELDETDSAKLRELKDKLLHVTAELKRTRTAMVEAMFGDKPLIDQNQKVLVERLVTLMAPVVREIAKRSLGSTELVLKRQTGDGRREEIFVSRRDLQQKLRPLGAPARAVFAPLELGELPPDEAPRAAVKAPDAAKAPEAKAPEVKTLPSRERRTTPAPGSSLFAEARKPAVTATVPAPNNTDAAVPLSEDSIDRLLVSDTSDVRKPS